MSKTIVCLWGVIREDISIVINNIKKMNGDDEIDFLISTWDDQVFDETLFKYVLKHPAPTQEYLDSINFPFTIQTKNVLKWRYGRLGCYSQFYNKHMINNFINDNNLSYDILIKSRTDLIFNTNFNFDYTKDFCYIPKTYHGSKGVGLNDHFMAGNFELMKRAIYTKTFEIIYPIIENSWNPETVNEKLLIKNSINHIEFDCTTYKLSPNRIFK